MYPSLHPICLRLLSFLGAAALLLPGLPAAEAPEAVERRLIAQALDLDANPFDSIKAVQEAAKLGYERVVIGALDRAHPSIRCAAAKGALLLNSRQQLSFVRAALSNQKMWDGVEFTGGEWGINQVPRDLFENDLRKMIRSLLKDPEVDLKFPREDDRAQILKRLELIAVE